MKCAKNCCSNTTSSSYIKNTLEILGPVILGSKPAEIMNLSVRDDNREIKLKELHSFFCNCIKISYKVIDMPDNSYRILFYNEESLRKVFTKKSVNFLKFIGYPKEYNFEEYLNILIDKLKEPDFPHEIGVFLGYPLKDVIGFMGYSNYKFVKTKYWRIYGDESISDRIYNKFLEDRAKFRGIIESYSISELRAII